jgi:hypothetical protein
VSELLWAHLLDLSPAVLGEELGDLVRIHPEMPQLAFHHEFLVGAFAAVKGGSVQEVLAHIVNTRRLPGAAVPRKSKVLRTPASVRYWVTASQTKNVGRSGR